MPSILDIQVSVSEIKILCSKLPVIVQNGSNRCKINQVLSLEEGELAWKTFNKRFDALFGEDCRVAAGQLCHIHCGEYGINKVNTHLSSINFDGMPLNLVVIKLNWLKAKPEYLLKVMSTCSTIQKLTVYPHLALNERKKLLAPHLQPQSL